MFKLLAEIIKMVENYIQHVTYPFSFFFSGNNEKGYVFFRLFQKILDRVGVFLINDEGLLWIPRRSKNKRIFPLALDASMGGHVESGETYEQAMVRELMEELRIDAHSVPHECIGSLNPHQHKTSAFMQVYLIKTNTVPNYNTNDFIEYYWLTPEELFARLDGGDSCKDDLPRIIKNLLLI